MLNALGYDIWRWGFREVSDVQLNKIFMLLYFEANRHYRRKPQEFFYTDIHGFFQQWVLRDHGLITVDSGFILSSLKKSTNTGSNLKTKV